MSLSTPPDNTWIVVFDGQSNASGQGPLPPGGVLSPTKYVDRLFLYTHGGQWWRAFEPSVSPAATYGGSLYPVLDVTPIGVGPALYFAQKFADLTSNVNIGLVNVGVGGSSMVQHAPSTSTATMYGAARALINGAKPKGKVKAYVFIQGERDAQYATDAPLWASRFTAFVAAVRSDHGADIPVFFAQLGTDPGPVVGPYWSTVKAQQASVSIPGVYMISTDDLPKQPDNIHYTNEGYQKLGERIALKLREVIAIPSESF